MLFISKTTIENQIIKYFGNEKYLYREKTLSGNKIVDSLVICGKIYLSDITMSDFSRRIEDSYRKYGKRSQQALKNQGLDFKALSHAYRAVIQTKQLLINGKIQYPFVDEDLKILMEIKQGQMKWKNIENYIYRGLEDVEKLQDEIELQSKFDYDFIKKIY